MVVEITPDGEVVIREEPTHRRLKRGEKLPEVRINAREAFTSGSRVEEIAQAETWIDALIREAPVAKFEGDSPAKVAYSMKVWLLDRLNGEKAK